MNAKVPLITLALVILVGFATYFFFIGPEFQRQTELQGEKDNLAQQEATLQAEIGMLKELQANQVRTRAQLNRISSFLPDGPDQPGFLASLQAVADSASVNVKDLSFGEPSDVEEVKPFNGIQLSQMTLSVGVEGDYFRLIDFLRRIEFQLGRAMVTNSVNLSPGGDGEEQNPGAMTMSMESVIYFYRPAGSDKNNPAPSPSASASAAPSDGASAAPTDGATPAAPRVPSDAATASTGG